MDEWGEIGGSEPHVIDSFGWGMGARGCREGCNGFGGKSGSLYFERAFICGRWSRWGVGGPECGWVMLPEKVTAMRDFR
jgi:hypothetical protein